MTGEDRELDKATFLGLEFDRIGGSQAVEKVLALARKNSFSYVVTPNVDHIVRLHGRHADHRLWASYRHATLRLCDSRIIEALATLSGIDLTLVPGSDLTRQILDEKDQVKTALVVGGDDALIGDLRSLYPHITWRHHAPPFGILKNPHAQLEAVEFIESCPAELVFLAIGSPQSEIICATLATRQRTKGVALCIGASLEFITGVKRRAPPLDAAIEARMALPANQRAEEALASVPYRRARNLPDLVEVEFQLFSLSRSARFQSVCRAKKNPM